MWTPIFHWFIYFNIPKVNQVFLDHCDPLHIADLLFHHPPSHIWVPTTVTMTTPLKLDRRWLHGPACEKQSDSLLLSLLPFFAPSLLPFVAYLKPSQLLNRLHWKFHFFILFFSPLKVSGCLGRLFFSTAKAALFLFGNNDDTETPFFPRGVSDGFCSLGPSACAFVNCKCCNLDISMVTQALLLSSCIFLRTFCPNRPTDMWLYS